MINALWTIDVSFTFGKPKNPSSIKKDCRFVKSGSGKKRYYLLGDLNRIQRFGCMPYLNEALKDEEPGKQIAAAAVLGKIKHPAAILYLAKSLKDSNAFHRRYAAIVLAEINDYVVLVPLVKSLDHL